MIILNFDEYNTHRKTLLRDLHHSVFVYPTDTIYGIGCDATNEKLVQKIRLLKKSAQPFSIIVPNKDWIYHHCVMTAEAEEWVRKLPGPYTLILRLKNKNAVARNVHNVKGADSPTIGVRMPNHWFLAVAYQLNRPIITTSANVTGGDFMTSLDTLDPQIRTAVDYIFYDGPKQGVLSTLIHLEGAAVVVQPRTPIKRSSPKIQFPIEEVKLVEK